MRVTGGLLCLVVWWLLFMTVCPQESEQPRCVGEKCQHVIEVDWSGGGFSASMADRHGGYVMTDEGEIFADQLLRRQEFNDALQLRSENVDFWPPELKFGTKPISRAAVGTIVIGNDSPTESLVLFSVSTDSDSFSVHVPAWLEILPNSEHRIYVIFTPQKLKRVEHTLTVITNFGNFLYKLSGKGSRDPYRFGPSVSSKKVPLGLTHAIPVRLRNPGQDLLHVLSVSTTPTRSSLSHAAPTSARLQEPDLLALRASFNFTAPLDSRQDLQAETWTLGPGQQKTIGYLMATGHSLGRHRVFVQATTTGPDLIAPFDLETVPSGVLATPDELDFGVLTVEDQPMSLKFSFQNGETYPIRVLSAETTPANPNVHVVVRGPSTLQPQAKTTVHVTYTPREDGPFHGQIYVRSEPVTSLGRPAMLSTARDAYTTVPFWGMSAVGSLNFHAEETRFRVGTTDVCRLVTEECTPPGASEQRLLTVDNHFRVPVAVLSFSVDDPQFVVETNLSKVLLPGESTSDVGRVTFTPVESDVLRTVNLHMVTNISSFDVPMTIFHGRLAISVQVPLHSLASSEDGDAESGSSVSPTTSPSDPEESTSEDAQIQFGALGVGESRSRILNVTNLNPISVPILSVRANIDTVRVHLSRVLNANGVTVQEQPAAPGTGTNAMTLPPGYSALFVVEVNSVRDEQREGRVTVSCSEEQFVIPFSYQSFQGSVTIAPSVVRFSPSFPGRVLKKSLVMQSTFARTVQVTSIVSSDRRFVPVLLNRTLASGVRVEAGYVQFEPARALSQNYMLSGWRNTATLLQSAYEDPAQFTANPRQRADWLLGCVLPEEEQSASRRAALWSKLSSTGANQIQATLTMNTDIVSGYAVEVEASLTWPRLLVGQSPELVFGSTPVGEVSEHMLAVHNPSDEPVLVQLLPPQRQVIAAHEFLESGAALSDTRLVASSACAADSASGAAAAGTAEHYLAHFFLNGSVWWPSSASLLVDLDSQGAAQPVDAFRPVLLPPRSYAYLGPVLFRPRSVGHHQSELLLRNNLTLVERLSLRGEATLPTFGLQNSRGHMLSSVHLSISEHRCPESAPKATRLLLAVNHGSEPIFLRRISIDGHDVCGVSSQANPASESSSTSAVHGEHTFQVSPCPPFTIGPGLAVPLTVVFSPSLQAVEEMRRISGHYLAATLVLERENGPSLRYDLLGEVSDAVRDACAPPRALATDPGKHADVSSLIDNVLYYLTSTLAVVVVLFSLTVSMRRPRLQWSPDRFWENLLAHLPAATLREKPAPALVKDKGGLQGTDTPSGPTATARRPRSRQQPQPQQSSSRRPAPGPSESSSSSRQKRGRTNSGSSGGDAKSTSKSGKSKSASLTAPKRAAASSPPLDLDSATHTVVVEPSKAASPRSSSLTDAHAQVLPSTAVDPTTASVEHPHPESVPLPPTSPRVPVSLPESPAAVLTMASSLPSPRKRSDSTESPRAATVAEVAAQQTSESRTRARSHSGGSSDSAAARHKAAQKASQKEQRREQRRLAEAEQERERKRQAEAEAEQKRQAEADAEQKKRKAADVLRSAERQRATEQKRQTAAEQKRQTAAELAAQKRERRDRPLTEEKRHAAEKRDRRTARQQDRRAAQAQTNSPSEETANKKASKRSAASRPGKPLSPTPSGRRGGRNRASSMEQQRGSGAPTRGNARSSRSAADGAPPEHSVQQQQHYRQHPIGGGEAAPFEYGGGAQYAAHGAGYPPIGTAYAAHGALHYSPTQQQHGADRGPASRLQRSSSDGRGSLSQTQLPPLLQSQQRSHFGSAGEVFVAPIHDSVMGSLFLHGGPSHARRSSGGESGISGLYEERDAPLSTRPERASPSAGVIGWKGAAPTPPLRHIVRPLSAPAPIGMPPDDFSSPSASSPSQRHQRHQQQRAHSSLDAPRSGRPQAQHTSHLDHALVSTSELDGWGSMWPATHTSPYVSPISAPTGSSSGSASSHAAASLHSDPGPIGSAPGAIGSTLAGIAPPLFGGSSMFSSSFTSPSESGSLVGTAASHGGSYAGAFHLGGPSPPPVLPPSPSYSRHRTPHFLHPSTSNATSSSSSAPATSTLSSFPSQTNDSALELPAFFTDGPIISNLSLEED